MEDLRSQLNEEQVLRRGEDGELARMSTTISTLERDAESLKASVKEQESEASSWRDRHGEVSGQLSVARESLADVQCRCATCLYPRAPCLTPQITRHAVCTYGLKLRAVQARGNVQAPRGGTA